MPYTFLNLDAQFEINTITIVGLLIAVAFLGCKVFQYLGIPQVVGFIVIGVFLGSSFLNIVPLELTEELIFISEIALGLIGFDIGSHLRYDDLKRMRRSIFLILLFESLGAFALVTSGIYFITKSWYTAIIFGAISSATAPAATVDVLAEYDAKGPLTTSLLAVVGLDDAMSLLLFSLSAYLAEAAITGSQSVSIAEVIQIPLAEIGGSLILGVIAGLLLSMIMDKMESYHDSMAISVGFVFLCVGLSEALGYSLILTTMIMGTTIVNRSPDHGKRIRFTIEQAGPVIYVLFFSLIGARLQVSLLPAMGIIGISYILLRSFGKYVGAYLGGALGGAAPAVRKNLGLGLLSQAGVAIGLALVCQKRFSLLGQEGVQLGNLVINVITATTFLVQILGPIGLKIAIHRAGEIGQARQTDNSWGV
jgi:Kef-type K+ transport system membrane component KefB